MHYKSFLALFATSCVLLYAGCDILGGGDGDNGTDTQGTPQLTTDEVFDSLANLVTDTSAELDTNSSYVKDAAGTYTVTDDSGSMTIKDVSISGDLASFTVIDGTDTTDVVFKLVDGPGTSLEGSIWGAYIMGDDTVGSDDTPFLIYLDPTTGKLVEVGNPDGDDGNYIGDLSYNEVQSLFDSVNVNNNLDIARYLKQSGSYYIMVEGDTLELQNIQAANDSMSFVAEFDPGVISSFHFINYDGSGEIERTVWKGTSISMGPNSMTVPDNPPFLIFMDPDSMMIEIVNWPEGGDSSSNDSGSYDGPPYDSAAIAQLSSTVRNALEEEETDSTHIGVMPYELSGTTLLLPDDMNDTTVLTNVAIANDTLSAGMSKGGMTTTMYFVSVAGGSAAIEGPVWELIAMKAGALTQTMDPSEPSFRIHFDATQEKFFGVNFPQ